jgi:O-antigen/teichoic acid export membrane protein
LDSDSSDELIGVSTSTIGAENAVSEPAALVTAPSDRAHGKKAVVNGAYLIGAFGLMQVLRFGANILFARMQSPRGEDPKFLQTAWTVQVVRGFYLWLASFVIAWPAAWFYGEHILLYFIPIVGATSAISGFNSVSMFLQNRRLALFRLALIELCSYAIPTGTALALMPYWPSVWLLVLSGVGSALVQLTLSHLILPKSQHRFRWEPEAAKELLGFGRWVFVSTFFTFLATQADRLIVGAATSVAKLGIYHIAAMFASAPTVMLTTLANNLLIPYFSRLRHSSPFAKAQTSTAHTLAGIFAWAMAAELVVASQDVIDLLYRGPFAEAGAMAPVVAIVSWFQMLQSLGNAIIFAHGKAQSGAFVNVLKLVAMIVFVPIGLRLFGFEGLLWAFALAEFVRYVATVYAVRGIDIHLWRSDLVLTVLLGLVFAATARDLVGTITPVETLTQFFNDHAAWTKIHDRGYHLARLMLETFCVGLASLLVLAGYWFLFHPHRSNLVREEAPTASATGA